MRLENDEPPPAAARGSHSSVNSEQRAYWNGEEAEHWLRYEDRYDQMLRPYTRRLLDAARLERAEAVLDIGCGCGQTTREAGRSAGSGTVLGIDLSRALIARARERAAGQGVANVRFEQADAQTHAFADSTADVVISRFGMMFFDDPVAGFANVRRALRPGGRLVSVCWQDLATNEWITVPGVAALQYVRLEQPGPPDAPGPFALAGPDRIGALLRDAGYQDVVIEPVSEQLILGDDATETAAFMMSSGPGRRVLHSAGPATVASVADALAEALNDHQSPAGIQLGSCAWLFSGRS